jgi:hypothetical protein
MPLITDHCVAQTKCCCCLQLSCLALPSPVLPSPLLFCTFLPSPLLSSPALFRPAISCPVLFCSALSSPALFRPTVSCPLLSAEQLTFTPQYKCEQESTAHRLSTLTMEQQTVTEMKSPWLIAPEHSDREDKSNLVCIASC